VRGGAALDRRRVRLDDAQSMIDIYNESVGGGGHSPVLVNATVAAMQAFIRDGERKGWPIWLWLDGETVVAWSQVRAIAWGTDICHRTGDFSLYVRKAWHGKGVAMRVVRDVFRDVRRHGFESITCWILGSNRKSLMLARACRMQHWGCLPRAARYGDRVDDVQIWGIHCDDAQWTAFMNELDARCRRLEQRALHAVQG
jgi:L-amino acid N-acyltransferase YncA